MATGGVELVIKWYREYKFRKRVLHEDMIRTRERARKPLKWANENLHDCVEIHWEEE